MLQGASFVTLVDFKHAVPAGARNSSVSVSVPVVSLDGVVLA